MGIGVDQFIESRIFDLAKTSISEFVSNHIIIVGYQDNLGKLLKLLTNHYPNKEICIITKTDFEERQVFKLLRQYKNLLYLKGETENPIHLLNAGINKSYSVIFLVESIYSKTNEDMSKILTFRSIDYFFNTGMILELWEHKSIRFLGYLPLDSDLKVIENEFMHPIFMSGKILYLSHLEKIIAKSYLDEQQVDAWIKLLSLGFSSSNTNVGFQTLLNNRESFPIILTLDLPIEYLDKEYYTLFNDLLLLDNPAICLGVFIENPLDYLTQQSQGKVLRLTRKQTEKLKITTSHKRKLVNLEVLDKVEQSYKDNLKIIRDISYNDRVILDYVDINKSHLPIFITNPSPGFILNERCKIQVLYNFHSKDSNILKRSSVKPNDRPFGNYKHNRHSLKNLLNQHSMSFIWDQAKYKLTQSQDNFFYYFDVLKDKIKGKYSESFKDVEKQRCKLNALQMTAMGFKV